MGNLLSQQATTANRVEKTIIEQSKEVVEGKNLEQLTGPENQDPNHQSIDPNNNVQTSESREHVDQLKKDNDIGKTQEDQDQR